MAEKNQTFEASLQELEKIVRRLEDGDLPLEESLKLFEKGVRLSRECQERLNQAERRIEVLLKDEDGNPTLQSIVAEDLQASVSKRGGSSSSGGNRRIVFGDDDNDEEEDESPF